MEEILDAIMQGEKLKAIKRERHVCNEDCLSMWHANGEILDLLLFIGSLTLKMILSGLEIKEIPLNSLPATI